MKIKNDALIALCGIISVLGGMLNGLIGTGAGIVYVFLFSLLYANDERKEKKDVFASCLLTTLPVCFISSFIYAKSYFSLSKDMLFLVPSAFFGGMCGAYFLNKIKNVTVVKMFACLTGISGVIMICKAI